MNPVHRESHINPEINADVESETDRFVNELTGLYQLFADSEQAPNASDLVECASTFFDFRDGMAREDTDWTNGTGLSTDQKLEVIKIANRWNMLESSRPKMPCDQIVILGAHRPTLDMRIKYSLDMLSSESDCKDVIVLACFRPIHSKEGVANPEVQTELDLAIDLMEQNTGEKFIIETVTCWDDQPEDLDQQPTEFGVAVCGSLGEINLTFVSGSVPGKSERATTDSTFESMRSLLDRCDARILFVTTSLHLPYQSFQASQRFGDQEWEMVGVGYEALTNLSVSSPDYMFRIVLQEIGATIKNKLQTVI